MRNNRKILFYVVWSIFLSFPLLSDSSESKRVLENRNIFNNKYSNELILAAIFDHEYVSDGLVVKSVDEQLYLPLSEIFSILKFPIFVSPEEGRVDGWYIEKSNTIDIDVYDKKLHINGEEYEYHENDILIDEYDLYAKSDAIENWFPLFFEINEDSQTLFIASSLELPIQKAKKRKEQQKSISSKSVHFSSKLPKKIPSYELFDWPTTAVRLVYGYQNNGASGLSYGIEQYGDLLGLNGQLSLQGDVGEDLDSAFLSLGRRDLTRSMFGPLKVAEVKVGDISLPMSSLVGGSLSGRGIKLSNRYLTQRFDVNRMNFEGVLKSGYEVELYINARLVRVFYGDETGRYYFENVELFQGENAVKIIFHGPSGEYEEVEKRVFVGERISDIGEVFFDFALMERGKSVFEDALTRGGESSELIGLSSMLKLSLGVGKGYELATFVADNGEGEQYFHSALNKRVGNAYYSFALAQDDNQKTAYSFNLNTNSSVSSRSAGFVFYPKGYSRFNGSVDEFTDDSWATNFDISRSYGLDGISRRSAWRIGTIISGEAAELKQLAVNGSYDKKFRSLNLVANGVYTNDFVEKSKNIAGTIRMRTLLQNRRRISGSFDMNYNIFPEFEIVDTNIGASIKGVKGLDVNLKLSHKALEGKSVFSIGSQKKYKNADLSFGTFFENGGEFGVRFGTEFSLIKHPSYTLPRVREYYSAEAPRIAVHAFEDWNLNGIYDDGESSASNIGLLYNGLPINAHTDINGNAVVERLARDVAHDITILPSSVLNPNFRPELPLYAIAPRPGRLSTVQLPLIPTRDIEGVVTFASGGKETSAANVRLLVSSVRTGHEYEVFTEFDGLYAVSGVPIGEYEVSVDQEYLDSVGLVARPANLSLKLMEGNSSWVNANFVLSRVD